MRALPRIIQPRTQTPGLEVLFSTLNELKNLQRRVEDGLIRLNTAIENAKRPQKGEKGLPGRDGYSPDTKVIVEEVLRLLPNIPDEKTLVNKVLAKVPSKESKLIIDRQKDSNVDYELILNTIMDKFEKGKAKIPTKYIDGLDNSQTILRNFIARGSLHGGGDTVAAGTNITITTNNRGQKVITSSGSGGGSLFATETPSGVIDGNNKTYTLAHTPVDIVSFYINGEYIHPSEYSILGSTITFVNALSIALNGTAFTITYTYGGTSMFNTETPSGAVDGVNKSYTVTKTINNIVLFSIGGEYIHPPEYSVSVSTITFVTALDASLASKSFTIVYI